MLSIKELPETEMESRCKRTNTELEQCRNTHNKCLKKKP